MEIIISLLTGLLGGGGLAALIAAIAGRRKLRAEAGKLEAESSEVIERAAVRLVESVANRIGQLEDSLREMEEAHRILFSENLQNLDEIARLERLLVEAQVRYSSLRSMLQTPPVMSAEVERGDPEGEKDAGNPGGGGQPT